MSKRFLFLAITASLVLSISAANFAEAEEAPAEAMMIGVFHFANPGRDVVKAETTDVMDPASQAYLDNVPVFGPIAGTVLYGLHTNLPMHLGILITVATGVYFCFVRDPA